MPIAFPCPRCTVRLRVEDDLAGRKVRCRGCEQVVLAPERSGSPLRHGRRTIDPGPLLRSGPIRPARRRRRRPIALGVAAAFVIVALGIAVWQGLDSSRLPALIREIPDGDFFLYRNDRASALFPTEGRFLDESTDRVTVYGEGSRMEAVTLYRGEFHPEKVEADYQGRGYETERIEQGLLLLNRAGGDALWISGDRALTGRIASVRAAIRALQGKGPRFEKGLQAVERRALERLAGHDFVYFGRSPSPAERHLAGGLTRGITRVIPATRSALGFGFRSEGPDRGRVTVVIVGPEAAARIALRPLDEYLENLTISASDGVTAAQGGVTLPRLRMRENEAAVIDALRALVRAEQAFHREDLDRNGRKDYWTGDVSGLYRLVIGGKALRLIDAAAAAADLEPRPEGEDGKMGPPLARRPYRGYSFLMLEITADGKPYRIDVDGNQTAFHHPDSFAVCAVPARPGIEGEYTFLVDQDGVVYKRKTDGQPIRRRPRDFGGEGWREAR